MMTRPEEQQHICGSTLTQSESGGLEQREIVFLSSRPSRTTCSCQSQRRGSTMKTKTMPHVWVKLDEGLYSTKHVSLLTILKRIVSAATFVYSRHGAMVMVQIFGGDDETWNAMFLARDLQDADIGARDEEEGRKR
jgi:hypothetical protein